MPQYYEILGVDEKATREEIKDAFTTRVKQVHPDHNDHPNAAQQFQQLKEAYDVLRDPESRERYDSEGFAEGADGTGPDDGGSKESSESVHWKDNTRGSPEAEYVWNNDTDRVAEPAPSTSTANQSMMQRGLGYFVAGSIPMGLGVALTFNGYSHVFGSPIIFGGTSFWVFAAAMFVATIVCIYVAEAILQTDRRMPSP